MIKKVAILGAGLLGGSVALSIRKHLPDVEVALWARREEPLALANEMGIELASTDLARIVDGADIVILATPVGVMADLSSRVLEIRGNDDFILTDVGSIKRLTHEVIEPIVKGRKAVYVGSHPMAGSEVAGIAAADVELLDRAACIITTSSEEREVLLAKNTLHQFWSALGCRVREMSPEDHDYAVARISHFPHVLASIVAKVGLEFEDIAELAGGGLRDTSRVAAGEPALWSEILLENRDALQRSLAESIVELASFQEILRTNDHAAMTRYLKEAKRKRELLDS